MGFEENEDCQFLPLSCRFPVPEEARAPNRPQKEPPSEYPWDKAVQVIAVVALSAVTAIYSRLKIFR